MTIIDLPSRGKRVTPRPTVATPVLRDERVIKCIAEIDHCLDCLFCVYGTLAGSDFPPEEAVEALNGLHKTMRKQIDTLYTLG